VFLDEGSSKTRLKKYRKNKSDPSPFSYSDPPTHHGGPRLFFVAGPLKLLAKKVEGKKTFPVPVPVVFPLRFFLIAFLAVSLYKEPKNTTQIFSKIRPKNLKKSQKKVPWHLPRFFSSFLRRPLPVSY
jgi:hypothetical protein